MIFSLVILALILGIAYFHLVQGLLSGIISMVLAVVAATMAVGYHEAVVTGILGGRLADYANSMMLCVIFAAVYGIGRLVFDSLIPGNIRLPHLLDVIGGTLCGVVVGICATGILALAMESMPLGPSILMHSRYTMAEDRDVTVNGVRRQETARIVGALDIEGDKNLPDPSKEAGLLVGADTILTNYVAYQSEDGAMAGGTALRARHPDLVRELFFQRVGIENSAKRTAMNVAGHTDVTVDKLFAPAQSLLQMDGENPSLNRARKLDRTFKVAANQVPLIVRIVVARGAADSDGRFRFSPGSIRLLTGGKDYTPVGVIYEPGRVNLLMNFRVDDFLVATLDKDNATATIDLMFAIDKADVLEDPAAKEGLKVRSGAFIEVKRLARVDLSEKEIEQSMPTPASDDMLWKKEAVQAIGTRMAETGAEKP